MKCKECGHKHQNSNVCGYPLEWTSNNIPKKVCLCKKLKTQEDENGK